MKNWIASVLLVGATVAALGHLDVAWPALLCAGLAVFVAPI